MIYANPKIHRVCVYVMISHSSQIAKEKYTGSFGDCLLTLFGFPCIDCDHPYVYRYLEYSGFHMARLIWCIGSRDLSKLWYKQREATEIDDRHAPVLVTWFVTSGINTELWPGFTTIHTQNSQCFMLNFAYIGSSLYLMMLFLVFHSEQKFQATRKEV